MEWNDETVSQLQTLWAEGLSTAEIGRRMGVSKNAVVGKAHRLNLLSRPSPIRRDPSGASRRRPPRRATGPTLPALVSATAPLPALDLARAPVERPAPVLRSVLGTARPSGGGRILPCCWPIGEPGTANFRFCDVDSEPGKPYCAQHAAVAYVRVPKKEEDAA